jgi:hypothetical protein
MIKLKKRLKKGLGGVKESVIQVEKTEITEFRLRKKYEDFSSGY